MKCQILLETICMKSQILFSEGDSLHEMSNPVFWEKYHKFVVCPESSKG